MTSYGTNDPWALLFRLFAWGTVAATFAFLFENYLIYWRDMPAARAVLAGETGGLVALGVYLIAALLTVGLALKGASQPLRADSARISALVAYLVRAAFFAILLVGVVDGVISFLRVEALLEGLVGKSLADNLGLSRWRGPYVHMPIVLLGFVIAAFTRTLGFYWFALLVVVVQLLIVVGRFIFSYEQAFSADLVRLWYAALFLFASAYTLVEEGHVRVDVFYAGMSQRGRALVNGFGSVFLGMSLCWVILIAGTASSASTIIAPVLSYETAPQGTAMYTKYFMAGFLGLFAVSMMLQFAAYLLKAVADWRGEPDPDAPDDARTTQPAMGT